MSVKAIALSAYQGHFSAYRARCHIHPNFTRHDVSVPFRSTEISRISEANTTPGTWRILFHTPFKEYVKRKSKQEVKITHKN
jgi:hypothetical protein